MPPDRFPASAQSLRLVLGALLLGLLAATGTAQTGLNGEYFDDIQLSQLAEVRNDPVIDFTSWTSAPHGTAVVPDNIYAERWTGFVLVDEPGEWDFSTFSNDGVRLWVAGELLIDNWTQHSATLDTGTLELEPGWYPIRLEHFQNGGNVVLQLLFAGPGQAQSLIPAERLGVLPGATLPTVTASADRHAVVDHGPIQLHASAKDDGPMASWRWTQIAGPAALLGDTTRAQLDVEFSTPGLHRFRVFGTDADGNRDSAEVDVEVIQLGPILGNPTGTFRPWHRATISFVGPDLDEQSATNPFLDYRLDVLFVHGDSGAAYRVPGFFAADGNAAETGASSGSVWRVHFSPDREGQWYFQASFRQGPGIAASSDPLAGTPVSFDGASGYGAVGGIAPTARKFRAQGRFTRDGHYLRHAQTGRPFLKGGANSPENLLAFADFDQTTPSHLYAPHVGDWQFGDPSWQGGKGHGLIGGLNYLASHGVNAMFFLTFTVDGDGDDVWPWTSRDERLRYDVSKLEQWEIVFEHMDELGVAPHMVLQERENDNGPVALDGGALGTERKVYHRELVARFGHHNGMIWNLGEETTLDTAQLRELHDDIERLDAYDHPIVLHTNPFEKEAVYQPLLDIDPVLDGPSLQNAVTFESHSITLAWRAASAAAGRPWVLSVDEIGPAGDGLVPDSVDFWHDGPRKKVLWANLMAGGSGVEWYFGYDHPHNDLTCEDWRSRDHMWALTGYALDFFEVLPLDDLEPGDDLVINTEAWCLADPGECYAAYMTNASNLQLDLGTSTSLFEVRWFDPGTGEWLNGGVQTVQGPGLVDLSNQPSHAAEDLAVVVSRINQAPVASQLVVTPDPFPGHADLVTSVRVSDPDGFSDVASVRFYYVAPTGQLVGSALGTYVGADTWQVLIPDLVPIAPGVWPVAVVAVDAEGARSKLISSFVSS